MMNTTALELVKARIGITSKVRDFYLEKIIEGVISELKNIQGLSIDNDDPHQLMFVVDLADWRYHNRNDPAGMPRHLQFRLHNLVISSGGGSDA